MRVLLAAFFTKRRKTGLDSIVNAFSGAHPTPLTDIVFQSDVVALCNFHKQDG